MQTHDPLFPRAILHVDADSFFASVEQACNPLLKGRPVVTGAERGVVIAMSYEAKVRGIKRGMLLSEAKRICAGVVCLPGDYENYGLFSKRMFTILRRFTPVVEEYSIDEAFADLSGLKRLYRSSYAEIARRIKETIEAELDITVSVGVSVTKSLAKLGSKFRKPSGLTLISKTQIRSFLAQTPLDRVWGFGLPTAALLRRHGMESALDFIEQPMGFIRGLLGKKGLEIHHELSGTSLWALNPKEKTSYVSMSKVKTFTPPSSEQDFVYAQAMRNLEGVCAKARRYGLLPGRLRLFLRRQDFRDDFLEVKLDHPSSSTSELVTPFRQLFRKLYRSRTLYRSTGVSLGDLATEPNQLSLFGEPESILRARNLFSAVDHMNARYGSGTLVLADSLSARHYYQKAAHEISGRKKSLLPGENLYQRLGMPLWRLSL